ncbi:MAG TPA: phosphoenolpyruvate carboxylase [Vicinamibacterales bacterium]|nr:phosphoenolpyruvate carboxylase [Vicinamibacterales bacterium]
MSDDPHKPLRDDVRLLGELLGQTLRALEGNDLFGTVERVRALAKSARAGAADDFDTLAAELSRLPVDAALPVARAFSHFLHLANVAEQHHRVRRRRAYERDAEAPPQRGSCAETFPRLLSAGISPDALHQAVSSLRIELVLTAHPTEIARRTLVQKYNRIAAALAAQDREDLTRPERDEIEATLFREIMAAWGTNDVRAQQPTPLDEVRSGLIVFEESLWQAVPRYLRGVDRALRSATGRGLPLECAPVTFGSWIGGDRDGNPNVTPEVTRRACLLSRWVAATLYLHEIDAVRNELSISAATGELRAAAGDGDEPYRALLRGVRDRLRATRGWIERSLAADADLPHPDGLYLDAGELAAALRLCADSLERTGYGHLADGQLADVRRRLATFGMTLARLDIRQEADRHTDALAAIVAREGLGGYARWDEQARVAFLTRELESRRLTAMPDLDCSPEVRDVLDTFRTMAALPRSSLGAYVITMASHASDVLAVLLLQQMAGLAEPLRVVPLFETSRDLENAGAVLDALFTNDRYRERIGGRQEVMIGYSDSAKDVGRFAAAWDLYRAQEAVLEASRRHGVDVTLFHGRGGSAGRGGGPTYLAIMAQPSGSIDGTLRVTEQGEMLQALFGLPEIAIRTMDVYTTASLEAWLLPAPPPRTEWRALMDRLRDEARETYRGMVYDDPQFLRYFGQATPESELSAMNIGSRPARRTQDPSVKSLRAIPWQFAWTQTRLLLGAWLGIESALEAGMARGDGERLREMYREWTYFRSVIDLIEMVLAKAEPGIAAEYDRRLVSLELQPIGAELRDRLRRAMRAVLSVTGHRDLIESNAVLRRSIDVRNPYVDPINLLQVEILRRLRARDDDRVRAALQVTINGIAAGMRNTG